MDGPLIKKASSLGVIEADFYGRGINLTNLPSTEITDVFRIRHAFVQLTWKDCCTLLHGQTWHPLYIAGADPRTISFNTGDPMDTFIRDPQIRFIYSPTKNVDLIFTAATQVGLGGSASDGPLGTSATYCRNAIVPILDAQLHLKFGENNKYWFGAAIDFMRLVPRLETNLGFKAYESINNYSAILFSVINWENFSMRNKILYIQNGSYLAYIGGYAVHSIDPVTDHRTYTSIAGTGFWTDWDITPQKQIIPGLFFGFVKNLGAQNTVIPDLLDANGNTLERRTYGLGTDVDYVVRVSPRTRWLVRNFEFSGEFEFTRAAYGTPNNKDQIMCTDPVNNYRFLFAMFYYF